MGPLVSGQARDKVSGYVEDGSVRALSWWLMVAV